MFLKVYSVDTCSFCIWFIHLECYIYLTACLCAIVYSTDGRLVIYFGCAGVLVVACEIFTVACRICSFGTWESSSLTGNQTWASCIESLEA